MVSLPAFPAANNHVTGMPRRHKLDADSNMPYVWRNASVNVACYGLLVPAKTCPSHLFISNILGLSEIQKRAFVAILVTFT